MKIFERNTAISKNVIQILEEHHAPISVSQVTIKLNKLNLTPNKSTLYRIFDKLKEKKRVTELILKNGITYFELKSNHHHHHFVCEDCDIVYCLSTCHLDKLNINTNDLTPNSNFKVKHHEFTLYGICDLCEAA